MVNATINMNASLHRLLVGLIIISFLFQSMWYSVPILYGTSNNASVSLSYRTRININENENHDTVDENCTRLDNGTLVCQCDVYWNNTYYPCWMEIGTPNPTPPPPPNCLDCSKGTYSNSSTSKQPSNTFH